MKAGIFGGSFDPPHKGHIAIALAAKEQLGLDRLIMVPTGQAPHKPDISADVRHRVNMCREICEKFGFELSCFEAEKQGNCYTKDLLEHFKQTFPDDELVLIVGGDSLDYMDKWFMPEKIFPLCTVAVARRKGSGDEKADLLREKFDAKIQFLDCDYFDFSSTEVRKTVLNDGNISSQLLPETAEYIIKNNLYR